MFFDRLMGYINYATLVWFTTAIPLPALQLTWLQVCVQKPLIMFIYINFLSELLQNKGFNKSVDIYAFAIILWEIFAAEIPFLRLDVNEIRNRVISGKRPPIPSYGFTPRFVRLLNDCWFVNSNFF